MHGKSSYVGCLLGAQEDYDGQGHNPFMVRHARVWYRAFTIQLILGGSAIVQFFNSRQ